jgi:hypothetical protein
MAGTESHEDEVEVKVKGSDGLVWPGGEIVAKGLGSATLGEPDPVIASCPSRTMRQGHPRKHVNSTSSRQPSTVVCP